MKTLIQTAITSLALVCLTQAHEGQAPESGALPSSASSPMTLELWTLKATALGIEELLQLEDEEVYNQDTISKIVGHFAAVTSQSSRAMTSLAKKSNLGREDLKQHKVFQSICEKLTAALQEIRDSQNPDNKGAADQCDKDIEEACALIDNALETNTPDDHSSTRPASGAGKELVASHYRATESFYLSVREVADLVGHQKCDKKTAEDLLGVCTDCLDAATAALPEEHGARSGATGKLAALRDADDKLSEAVELIRAYVSNSSPEKGSECEARLTDAAGIIAQAFPLKANSPKELAVLHLSNETYFLCSADKTGDPRIPQHLTYFPKGEDAEDWGKEIMVSFIEHQDVQGLSRAALAVAEKKAPGTAHVEVLTQDRAVIHLADLSDLDAQYSIIEFRKVPQGILSIHFVFKETAQEQEKSPFESEVESHRNSWAASLHLVADQWVHVLTHTARDKGLHIAQRE